MSDDPTLLEEVRKIAENNAKTLDILSQQLDNKPKNFKECREGFENLEKNLGQLQDELDKSEEEKEEIRAEREKISAERDKYKEKSEQQEKKIEKLEGELIVEKENSDELSINNTNLFVRLYKTTKQKNATIETLQQQHKEDDEKNKTLTEKLEKFSDPIYAANALVLAADAKEISVNIDIERDSDGHRCALEVNFDKSKYQECDKSKAE